jgi:hypothetical protein
VCGRAVTLATHEKRDAPFLGRGIRIGEADLSAGYEGQLRAQGLAAPVPSALLYLVGAVAPCSSWQVCTQRAICSMTHHALQSETE